jgi:CHAT domain-containing protein
VQFDRERTSIWYWNLRFLYAEILTAQSNRKAADNLLHDPVPVLPGLDQAEVRRLIDIVNNRANGDRALQLLAKARASSSPELLVRIDLVESIVLYNSGKPAEAQASAQMALDLATRRADLYQQSQALSNLCLYTRALHQYEESIAYGLRALSAADRIGARRIASFAHGNLGSTYAWLGDFDAAANHQQQAIRILEQIGARSNLMVALGELGVLYDRQDDFPKALVNFHRAFDLALQLESKRDAARFAWNISLVSIKAGQWDPAEQWNNRADELLRAAGDTKPSPPVERNRARIAWGRGRPQEAAAICRRILAANPNEPFIRWESYYLLGIIDAAAKRYPQADRNFESTLEAIGQVRSELLDSSNRITLLSRYMPFYQAYVATAVDQNDDARALRIVESSRARVLSERLGRSVEAQQFPSPASFEQVAASAHTAILSFWIAPDRSFAWLITANRVDRFLLPRETEISALVTQYRETVEHSLRDPLATSNSAGLALWHALMEPIAPKIPKDASLIVIPDGPLHRLNLETLIVPAPQPHYWVDDVQIALSPSITIAASAPRAAVAPAPRALLVIGDPAYKGTSYEPLPKAADEIRGIQAHLSGWTQQVYQGAQASPPIYRQSNPARFSLIHFAAHAEANYERPLESAIVLSARGGTYKLFAHDVVDIPIRASLVTVSACRSAGTRAYAGEGLMGFAWAFLRAGARAVIAGLWDVSDSSTGQLMDRLYSGISAGEDPVSALRAAKLSLLHGTGNFQKPFYWAPFEIYLGSAGR